MKLDELHKASVIIKFDLRSMDEVAMEIKMKSLLKDDVESIKHLEIPFIVCMSTSNDKPGEFTDETHRFSDSHQITYKVPKYFSEKYLYLSLKPERDCILKTTATASFA